MTMAMEPVVKEITVPADPAEAFRRFTAGIGRWWPRASHSVFGDRCAEVRMEDGVGGRLYEVSEDGRESEWGSLTAWDPPRRLAFTWHPGREAGTAQEVAVTFAAAADGSGGTDVRLVHTGWERLGDDAAATRDGYEGGWNVVLGRYEAGLAALARPGAGP